MKKLFIAVVMFLGLTIAASAQTTAPAGVKKDTKAKSAKTVDKAKTPTTSGPTKKDGTADKRFKANKDASGPLKKDGTPDMRYKNNKDKKP